MDVGSLELVGVPPGVTQVGGRPSICSSRHLDLTTQGNLLMNAGGDTTHQANTTISNATGVMTFNIGGNLLMDAGTSVAQIGNATTYGPSDLLFQNIGGNLSLQGGRESW